MVNSSVMSVTHAYIVLSLSPYIPYTSVRGRWHRIRATRTPFSFVPTQRRVLIVWVSNDIYSHNVHGLPCNQAR